MPSPWETFVDSLIAGGKQIAKDEKKKLVSGAKYDANEFVRTQGQKLEDTSISLEPDRSPKKNSSCG